MQQLADAADFIFICLTLCCVVLCSFEQKQGSEQMKVAVSSEGPGLESQVDPRFGRAGGFVIVDMETMQADYVDNGASQAAAQGAGIQTAERLAGLGVQAVMSGYVGPKAFMALQAAGLDVYQDMDNRSVADAVRCLADGSVSPATAPNK